MNEFGSHKLYNHASLGYPLKDGRWFPQIPTAFRIFFRRNFMNKILKEQGIVNKVINSEPGAGKERAASGIKKLMRYVSKPARILPKRRP